MRPRPRHGGGWLNAAGRIAGVDLARGLAVLGMLAAHLLRTAENWSWSDPATWTAVVDGRSSILFATLAGVSIGLVTGGSAPPSRAALAVARMRLAIRAVALWVLGILLVLTGVPVYVILPAYAILFLLALPFVGLRTRVIGATAGALALVTPLVQPLLNRLPIWSGPGGAELDAATGWHYPFPVWLAFVLTGLALARAGVTRLTVQLRMLVAGAALATVGYGLAALPAPGLDGYARAVWTAAPHSSGLWEVVGSGGFAVAVLAVCLLVCRLGAVSAVLLPLRATGAMPLTAYTAQLVIWAAAAWVLFGDASELTGFRDTAPFWPLTIGIVVGCTAWAVLLGTGPLERVLAALSRRFVPGAEAPVRAGRRR